MFLLDTNICICQIKIPSMGEEHEKDLVCSHCINDMSMHTTC